VAILSASTDDLLCVSIACIRVGEVSPRITELKLRFHGGNTAFQPKTEVSCLLMVLPSCVITAEAFCACCSSSAAVLKLLCLRDTHVQRWFLMLQHRCSGPGPSLPVAAALQAIDEHLKELLTKSAHSHAKQESFDELLQQMQSGRC
jgi:hypothetical protein